MKLKLATNWETILYVIKYVLIIIFFLEILQFSLTLFGVLEAFLLIWVSQGAVAGYGTASAAINYKNLGETLSWAFPLFNNTLLWVTIISLGGAAIIGIILYYKSKKYWSKEYMSLTYWQRARYNTYLKMKK